MSSNNLRNIREGSGSAPLEKEVSRLAKLWIAKETKAQIDQVDEPEDRFPSGVDDETAVHINDELISTSQLSHDRTYRVTYEPDYNKVTLMLKGKSLGNTLKDYSGFDNHATIYGEPLLVDGGPFDRGWFTGGPKSIAMRFNRPTSDYVNEEYMKIPDATNLQVLGITTGISYMFRFRIFDLAPQAGINRTLFEKIDDSTPNNGAMVQLQSNGKLLLMMKIGGNIIPKESPIGTIVTNKPYTAFFTYAVSGDACHIYLKDESNPLDTGTDLTLSAYGGSVNWQSTLTDHSMQIFRRGPGSNGYLYGDFYDMYVYREQVISQTEAFNFFENKLTIYPQDFGGCIVPNHWQASA
jgi:hypothetical protein